MPNIEDLPFKRRTVLDNLSRKQIEQTFGWSYQTCVSEKFGKGQQFKTPDKNIILESYPSAGGIRLFFPEAFEPIEMYVDLFKITEEEIIFHRMPHSGFPEMTIVVGKNAELTILRGKGRMLLEDGVTIQELPRTFPPASAAAKPQV